MDTRHEIHDRSEILFLYQVRDCNPNGDPLEENQPRIDPETGVATVTDVRIKRTIRDYWQQSLQREIWIRNGVTAEGLPETGEQRAKAFDGSGALSKDAVLDRCIDARVFGCILQVARGGKKSRKKATPEDGAAAPDSGEGGIAITGPVQFSGFNRSLHRVSPQLVQGTAAFASKEGAQNKSFRYDHILPYAVIAVYGVINERVAQATRMSQEDRDLVLEGLWRGTEHLHSRSKMGHQPLALLELASVGGHRIGDLPSRLRLKPEDDREEIALRGLDQFEIDAGALYAAIDVAAKANRISRIRFRQDPRLKLTANQGALADALTALGSAALIVDTKAFDAW